MDLLCQFFDLIIVPAEVVNVAVEIICDGQSVSRHPAEGCPRPGAGGVQRRGGVNWLDLGSNLLLLIHP